MMNVHVPTKFCLICVLTFVCHHCRGCHEHGARHAHRHNDYQISEAPYPRAGRARPEPARFSPAAAQAERRYYVDRLFARYGRDGRLSFAGLERLLRGLGLGEARPAGRPAARNRTDAPGPGGCPGEPAGPAEGGRPRGHRRHHRPRPDGRPPEDRAAGHNHVHKHGPPSPEEERAAAGAKDADDVAAFPARGQKERGEHRHEDCLNGSQLLRNFGVSSGGPISPDLFAYLCPALLYQIDGRLCARQHGRLPGGQFRRDPTPLPEPRDKVGASAWICGLISITVISLLSLLGVVLIPIIKQGCFKFLLTFLVALAVGTMSGDALLHLLPHSQGEHGHEHGHGHEAESESFLEVYDAVLKGLVALAGVYLLFIIEHCIRMFKHYKQQRGKQKRFSKQKAEKSNAGRKPSDDKLDDRARADWLQLRPLAGADEPGPSEDRPNVTEPTDPEGRPGSPPESRLAEEEDPRRPPGAEAGPAAAPEAPPRPRRRSRHSHGHCRSATHPKTGGIASLAWMVIMGDGLHNFSDGLAIGAAFSASLTGGISTSIAVFCHELPHELGDFAVLLKAGMTVKQAIVYNLLSALMAYVGMVIGTAVGQYANDITLWIFAVTAGMFLYVALVDMLPEMLHGDGDHEELGHCPVGQFVLQNLGLLLGFAIMLLIALFEDHIVLDIQF